MLFKELQYQQGGYQLLCKRGVFKGVAVCIIIPGFKILKVHYNSVDFSDTFFNLFPPINTCQLKSQVVMVSSFPVYLFSKVTVLQAVVLIEGICRNIGNFLSIPHFFYVSLGISHQVCSPCQVVPQSVSRLC